jgi:hypothetical protein
MLSDTRCEARYIRLNTSAVRRHDRIAGCLHRFERQRRRSGTPELDHHLLGTLAQCSRELAGHLDHAN